MNNTNSNRKPDLKTEFLTRGMWIFLSVFGIGLFVHGSRFLNEERFFDDLVLEGVGTTYTSGRWFLECLNQWKIMLLGSNIHTKGFEAILILATLALMVWQMARDLEIHSKGNLILLGAVVVTFPYVISLFGFTYTGGFYNLGMLMALAAASVICHWRGLDLLWRFLLCVVLLGLSMAVYQTTLCMFTAYLLLLLIKASIEGKNEHWGAFIGRCAVCAAGCAGGAVFYYLSNKLALKIVGLEMSSYQGLDTMGQFTPRQMLNRIYLAYREFFIPSTGNNYSLYDSSEIRAAYWLCLLALAGFGVFFIARAFRQRRICAGLQLLILFAAAPAAMNSVFLTADAETTNIYTMMMFGEVMVFVSLIYAVEYVFHKHRIAEAVLRGKWKKYLCAAACVPVIFTAVYFAYIANVCYTKASFQYEQALGYFNRLIARIQSTDGYEEGMPAAYLRAKKKNEEAYHMEVFDDLYRIAPYDYDTLLNIYNWDTFMERWCGYELNSVDDAKKEELSELQEVKDMPHYPDAGSIKVIDGVIVVKF